MTEWTDRLCAENILDFNRLNKKQRNQLKDCLNNRFPFNVFEQHRQMRHNAFANEKRYRDELETSIKTFPDLIFPENTDANIIRKCAFVLTAGGEGERLRLSLEKMGYGNDTLKDFTKATFPLPGFFEDYGTLHVNLTLIARLEKRYKVDLPVIVTTGPQGSATAKIIPEIIKKHENFGLKRLLIIQQQERLHLTCDDRVAWFLKDDMPFPVTHPDETGGPLMSLKYEDARGVIPLEWLNNLGVNRILVMQATALYNPDMILAMATAEAKYDCIGVGIPRRSFPMNDPYGAYVAIENKGSRKVVIVEQNVRDREITKLRDSNGYFLPYNTGFYVFDKDLLSGASLPDYATPPKEILPGLERSPKAGYAATDLITLAKNPAVLIVPEDWYSVLKNAENLAELSSTGKRYHLDELVAIQKQKNNG